MIQIDLATLVKRLNPFATGAGDGIGVHERTGSGNYRSACSIQMLLFLAATAVIAEKADIGGVLRQALTVENYATSRSADSYPRFRPCWLSG
jgi:type VI secretion system protein VasG